MGIIEVALKKRPEENFSWSKTHTDYLVAISMLGPSISQCECGRGGEERVGSVLLLPGSSAVNIPARTRAGTRAGSRHVLYTLHNPGSRDRVQVTALPGLGSHHTIELQTNNREV